MKQRYFLEIAFDGSNYFGWQIQPNQVTVQETVEKVLSNLYQESIKIVGCGRTDTGVHASQYFLHFDAPFERKKLQDRLKLMFPKDIDLLNVHEVTAEAHTRFDATARSYTYFLHHRKNIFRRHYSLSTDLKKLDEKAIRETCEIFEIESNYEPLSKKNESIKNSVSIVDKAEFIFSKDRKTAQFNVSANRYLHNQIRRMLGAVLLVGVGKLKPEDIAEAMQKNIKLKYNNTVAPHGLFLHSIKYPYICT